MRAVTHRVCLGLQIFDLETRYIATANPQGNALKGARHRCCLPPPDTRTASLGLLARACRLRA